MQHHEGVFFPVTLRQTTEGIPTVQHKYTPTHANTHDRQAHTCHSYSCGESNKFCFCFANDVESSVSSLGHRDNFNWTLIVNFEVSYGCFHSDTPSPTPSGGIPIEAFPCKRKESETRTVHYITWRHKSS